jgi:hypothetical protein
MAICAVGAQLMQAGRQTDGQTDMTTLIGTFHHCASAAKNDDTVEAVRGTERRTTVKREQTNQHRTTNW